MSEPTADDRAVARVAATALGGSPTVERFYDAEEEFHVDLLRCSDQPTELYSSFSTIGLHEFANELDGKQISVEMLGVAPVSAEGFPNVLATAAFLVIKDHWLCAPGVIYPSLLSEYGLSDSMEHIMWFPPFPWPDLGSVEVSNELNVHWLLAVPISENERQFVYDRGFDAFESLLEENDVEYYNLARPSVI